MAASGKRRTPTPRRLPGQRLTAVRRSTSLHGPVKDYALDGAENKSCSQLVIAHSQTYLLTSFESLLQSNEKSLRVGNAVLLPRDGCEDEV